MPTFYPGFDTSDYPGDDAMAWFQANTGAVWCGYYLAPAPSQQRTTWMGRRATLAAAGWGFAPIYVGEQVIPPGSLNPSAAKGSTDGADAAAKMASEGFPANSCVYLDLENGPPLPQSLSNYAAAWCDAVAAAGYTPGIYCSHAFAAQIAVLRPNARIWAFKVPTTAKLPAPDPFPTLDPANCYATATAWQCQQNCLATGYPTNPDLCIDISSASTPDPSAPGAPAPS
jgi:hypothetical protein